MLESPLFPRATLAAPSDALTIDTPGASKKTRFARTITLQGRPVTAFMRHSELANATLRFEMSP